MTIPTPSTKSSTAKHLDQPGISATPGNVASTAVNAPSRLKQWWNSHGRNYTIIAAMLTFAYSAAITTPSLFMDDYNFLFHPFDGDEMVKCFIAMGRPLTGYFLQLCRSIITVSFGSELCHGLALLGLVGFTICLYRLLRYRQMSTTDSILISLLFALLPASQVFVAWITAGSATFAMALSVYAVQWIEHSKFSLRLRNSSSSWIYLSLGILSQVLSLNIYQPAAFIFCSVALLTMLIDSSEPAKERISRGFTLLSAAIASVGLYFVTGKIYLYLSGIAADHRAEFITIADIPTKLKWFAEVQLYETLSLWSHTPIHPLVIATIVFIVIGIVAELIHQMYRQDFSWLDQAQLVLLSLGIVLFSNFLSLVVKQNWASLRSSTGLAASILVLALLAVVGISKWLPGSLSIAGRRALMVGCLVWGVASTQTNMTNRMVLPQSFELQYMASKLPPAKVDAIRRIHVIEPEWYEGVTRDVRYDEFGLPSSYVVAKPMVKLILHQRKVDYRQYEITSEKAAVPVPEGEDVLVVDMRELATTRVEHVWR